MSLRTYNRALTGTAETLIAEGGRVEVAIHTLYASGSGTLTITREPAGGGSETLVAGVTVSNDWSFPRTLNLEAGDVLKASGSGITLTASAFLTERSVPVRPVYGPGPQDFIAGDMQAGFFGEVSADELFTGEELALLTGVTEGASQNSTAGWLKFAHNGKIKYIAKQTLRHGVAWDHLYSRGIVYGTDDDGVAPRGTATNQFTTVNKDGSQFIVRLMTGASADPFPESDPLFFTSDMYQMDIGGGSEWNELIYRVCEDIPSDPLTDGMAADRHGGPQVGANWETYTAAELNITTGNGSYAWVQEQSDVTSASRARRGSNDLATFHRATASFVTSSIGWRPVLELIPTGGA